jgi:hypothetical protein
MTNRLLTRRSFTKMTAAVAAAVNLTRTLPAGPPPKFGYKDLLPI